jgi:hypothetical protein
VCEDIRSQDKKKTKKGAAVRPVMESKQEAIEKAKRKAKIPEG